ncbi:MAG: flavoprotein [Cyclobacteriaceae bacterium]
MLDKKKITLGVTGSIAAYKSAHLVRLLVKEGAEVTVIMTEAATSFITPLTLSTLSKKPVLIKWENNNTWNNHVDIGVNSDLLVIVPATANTIGKMANGLCDNLLLAVYLSARCKTLVCPAMDEDMYQHPSTQHNLSTLKNYGNLLMDVGSGELASGLVGPGRLAEPEEVVEKIKTCL